MNNFIKQAGILAAVMLGLALTPPAVLGFSYAIVDTGQDGCYGDYGPIGWQNPGDPYYGQDANYGGAQFNYSDNGDGTVTDKVTGLTWVQAVDSNKSTWEEALAGADVCNVGGYEDWRLPSIKELYSLINFNGSSSSRTPYLDTAYFDFIWGDEVGGRDIDSQFWSSNKYVGSVFGGMDAVFGVNFADGRIKGYGLGGRGPGGQTQQFVRYVRGNPAYGQNDYQDNADGTITDNATGLTWMQSDSGAAMTWGEALQYAENYEYGGYSDWRLPNAKELQSIVDYSRAPDAKDPAMQSAAIDPLFSVSDTESWYWTGTSLLEGGPGGGGSQGVYIAFGQAFGVQDGQLINVHGAGAQRSDPKTGDPADYAGGRGPQGDEVRIYNYVRLVRGGSAD
jgi:hypothetical protein